MLIRELVAFAKERQNVYVKKERGDLKPWTKDPILQTYRFANVFREQDKVTKWLATNWRNANAGDPNLWLTMTVARFLNNIPCMAALPAPLTWEGRERTRILKILKDRKAAGEQVFGGAYMVRSDPGCKIDYIDSVFKAMWKERKLLQLLPWTGETLAGYYAKLHPFRGLGSFMAAQIVADLKNCATPLASAPDWWDWAASGPGSRRGLSRVLLLPPQRGGSEDFMAWKEDVWFDKFSMVRERCTVKRATMSALHAQDFQGVLCEFDKYMRVKNGEGRPRSLYPGIEQAKENTP